MDVSEIRSRLLTGFKPKEQEIATPYFGELDGALKLVGLSGKQRLDLEEQATKDGTLNVQKFIALCIAACLRERSTGKPIFTPIDTLGPSGNGDGLASEIDSDAYLQLVKQVSAFIGNRSAQETKNGSEQTSDALPASSSLQGSNEQSVNSSTELTPVS